MWHLDLAIVHSFRPLRSLERQHRRPSPNADDTQSSSRHKQISLSTGDLMSYFKAKLRQNSISNVALPRSRWGSLQRSPILPSWISRDCLQVEGGKGNKTGRVTKEKNRKIHYYVPNCRERSTFMSPRFAWNISRNWVTYLSELRNLECDVSRKQDCGHEWVLRAVRSLRH